jgi:hypothetical protein
MTILSGWSFQRLRNTVMYPFLKERGTSPKLEFARDLLYQIIPLFLLKIIENVSHIYYKFVT